VESQLPRLRSPTALLRAPTLGRRRLAFHMMPVRVWLFGLLGTFSAGGLLVVNPEPVDEFGGALTRLFDVADDRNFTISKEDCVRGISPNFPIALRRLHGKLALMSKKPRSRIENYSFGKFDDRWSWVCWRLRSPNY